MEFTLQRKVRQIALGYGLEYKITNNRMKTYLAPAYSILRHGHPELSFPEFIQAVIEIRAEARQKQTQAAYDFENYGVMSWLRRVSGDEA